MTLTDILRACNVINPLAKVNKGRDPLELEHEVNKAFSQALPNRQYHTRATRSEHEVKPLCEMLHRVGFDIVLVYSGDGGVQNFMTSYARMLYEKYANNGETVLDFVKTINTHEHPERRMPMVLPVKRGTVNVYFDITNSEADVKEVARNLKAIQEGINRNNLSVDHLLRHPVQTMALFSSTDPFDVNALEIGTMYADGALYKWFDTYYSKNGLSPGMNLLGGETPSIRKAAAVTAQYATSKLLSLLNLPGGAFAKDMEGSTRAEITINGEPIPTKGYKMAVALLVQPDLYTLKPGHKMPGKKEGIYQARSMKFYVAEDHFQGMQLLASLPSVIQGMPVVRFHNGEPPEGMVEKQATDFSIRQQGNYETQGGCTYIIDGSRTCSAHHTVQATLGPIVQFLDIKGSENMMHDKLFLF